MVFLWICGLMTACIGEEKSTEESADAFWKNIVYTNDARIIAKQALMQIGGMTELEADSFLWGPCDPYEKVLRAIKNDWKEKPVLIGPDPMTVEFADKSMSQEDVIELLAEHYDFYPIAYDAIVFFVPSDSPIDDIPAQVVRDIYAGKISSWKQITANSDQQITAFQRNFDFYAQSVMENLVMKGTCMIEPPTYSFVPYDGTDELCEEPAGYDNSPGSIGYSMLRYFRGAYQPDDIKILSINQSYPTPADIYDHRYPWIVQYFVAIPKDLYDSRLAKDLQAYLCSDEGQRMLQHQGMLPCDPYFCKEVHKTSKNEMATGSGERFFTAYDKTGAMSGDGGFYLQSGPWYCYNQFSSIDHELKNQVEKWVQQAKHRFEITNEDQQKENRVYYFLSGGFVSICLTTGEGNALKVQTAVFHEKLGGPLTLASLFPHGYPYLEKINDLLFYQSMVSGPEPLGDFGFEQYNLKKPFDGINEKQVSYIIDQDGILNLVFEGENPYVDGSFWQPVLLVRLEELGFDD